jgi:hypothetical protein
MSTHPEPTPARHEPAQPSTHRASWTEYQRLLTAGVTPTTAALLAAGQPRPDDERAYWRQLAHRTPTTPTTRAAHAEAQRQRRAALGGRVSRGTSARVSRGECSLACRRGCMQLRCGFLQPESQPVADRHE